MTTEENPIRRFNFVEIKSGWLLAIVIIEPPPCGCRLGYKLIASLYDAPKNPTLGCVGHTLFKHARAK